MAGKAAIVVVLACTLLVIGISRRDPHEQEVSLEQQQLWEWGAGLDNKVPLGAPLEDVGGLEILRAIQRRGAAKDTFLPDVVKKDRRYSSGVFWGHTMHGHGAQKTQHRAAMETMNGVPVKRISAKAYQGLLAALRRDAAHHTQTSIQHIHSHEMQATIPQQAHGAQTAVPQVLPPKAVVVTASAANKRHTERVSAVQHQPVEKHAVHKSGIVPQKSLGRAQPVSRHEIKPTILQPRASAAQKFAVAAVHTSQNIKAQDAASVSATTIEKAYARASRLAKEAESQTHKRSSSAREAHRFHREGSDLPAERFTKGEMAHTAKSLERLSIALESPSFRPTKKNMDLIARNLGIVAGSLAESESRRGEASR